MKTPLKVLILEDQDSDARLVMRELSLADFLPHWTRVDTEAGFLAALDPGLDVILADYRIPGWDAMKALALLKERGWDIPFVIVSGSIGEDTAVAAMRQGATDYVLKDRLLRLGSAVRRALDDKRLRAEKRRIEADRDAERQAAELALRSNQARLAGILDAAQDAIVTVDGRRVVVMFNAAAERIFGRRAAAAIGLPVDRLLRAEGRPASGATALIFDLEREAIRKGGAPRRIVGVDAAGEQIPLEASVSRVDIGTERLYTLILRDISGRLRAERALAASETRYRNLFEENPLPMWVHDLESLGFVAVNRAAIVHYGYSRAEFLAMTIADLRPPDDIPALQENLAAKTVGPDRAGVVRHRKRDGSVIDVAITSHGIDFAGHRAELVLANDITAHRRAEEALRRSEREQRELAQQLESERARLVAAQRVGRVGSWEADFSTSKMVWSEEMHRIFETDPVAYAPTWQSFVDFAHPDDRPMVADAAASAAETPVARALSLRLLLPEGRIKFVEAHWQVGAGADGATVHAIGTCQDVTERVEAERKIARLNRIRAVIGGISSAMLRLRDREELMREACRVATAGGVFPIAWVSAIDPRTGVSTILGFHGDNAQAIEAIRLSKTESVPSGRPSQLAIRTGRPVVVNDLSADPTMAPVHAQLAELGYRSLAAFPLFIGDSATAALVLLAHERGLFDAEEVALLEWLCADLSFALEHIEKSDRLDHLAYYDAVTGLPNARLFGDRLDQYVQVARQSHGRVCVAVLDLERFTQVNDTLGRAHGDAVLREVGARLSGALAEPSTLSRIGADTFAIAIPDHEAHGPVALLERLFDALEQPVDVGGHNVRVGAQGGIAFYPADGDDGHAVFVNAEAALKIAKSSGERRLYSSSEMNARVTQRHALEEQLREAIRTGQFVLHYQPRMDMINGEIIGAEALIRWQHPAKGLIAPGEFIAVAEETGLIVEIGSWVIETVCAQQAAWLAAGVGVVPIAVNLSSVQFAKSDVLQVVRDKLALHAVAPAHLDLELTESAVMDDPAAAARTLRALRELGVGLALDDFGTGYSSLAHLKRFPFDSVKIDRSFVVDITSNAEDAAIATAIIAMAHRLKLKVVAEGVETRAQFNYLRAQDCDELQGNFFGAPAPGETLESLLRSGARMSMPAPEPADLRTLLIVDDEPGIRSALTRALRRDGYRILTAADAREGLEVLALNQTQVIISDQRMPGMSGTAFLETVRQLYPDTVRIILSGYTDLHVVTESVNRGSVFKLLTKPWDDDLLRARVRDAFRRYRPEGSR